MDEDGQEVFVRRRVVALCRCGRSRTKPLCDGAHGAGSAANGTEGGSRSDPPS
ncbi:MAG: CDGSH iron-sulfur domain-containing protein [Actinomycetota bacterium]|nr:CDGSH iron-sulfur domain-containing protein [Actinomycetota bacterium]